jgi:hypothetical protein
MPPSTPTPITPIRWALALAGLGLVVFAIVALTGPGRIDIDDGQARFEAGKNLVEQGIPCVEDPRVIWHRLPGRDGREYTYYRFPPEVAAAASVLIADALRSPSEPWRHFVFSLHGAVAAAVIAILYAVWFRRWGCSPVAAVAWAAGGIFCAPCWYYATSTFDEIIGALFVIAAVVSADAARRRGGWRLLLTAGCVGVAANCKPPLAAVLLPAIALADDPTRTVRQRIARAAVLVAGLVAGYAAYVGYDAWKFPPEVRDEIERILAERNFPGTLAGNPAQALLDLAVGPSSGVMWYYPPVILCLIGLWSWWRSGRRVWAAAALGMVVAVVGFCSLLSFYKGGVCWGPRYLTPVFALLWLFAPFGVAAVGRRPAAILLSLGVIVQVLALSIVPERLYYERRLPSGFYYVDPWLYLRPEIGHLFNRPRELLDALTAPPASEFTPAPAPSFCLPVADPPYYTGPPGIDGVRRYVVLNGLRPWWATLPLLPPDQRPVEPGPAAAVFGLIAAAGLTLVTFGAHRMPRDVRPETAA